MAMRAASQGLEISYRRKSRSDECFVDYVDGFLETMIRERRDASSRQCYSKRRTEKLKTPDAQTERSVRSLGRSNLYIPEEPNIAIGHSRNEKSAQRRE